MDNLLRRRLIEIRDKTEASERLAAPAWWSGDRAGERRALDDMRAGRLHWSAAHRHAKHGLDALEAGDIELAQACAWTAADAYISALEVMVTKLRPSERGTIDRSARPRGRPRKKLAP